MRLRTSLLDGRPGAQLGSQRPSFCSFPPTRSTSGREAVALAREAGLCLDPWQEFVLENSLGEAPDGRWLTRDVGLIVPRQNGKGGILEARELAGLFLFGERLVIHSAHQFDTSMEHFERMLALIEDRPDFERQVAAVSRSHGSEGIRLKSGQRLRFRTRTKGGGRGFSCDCLVLDEAMEMPDSTYSALRPTLSARDNPQVWHVGSAVDQLVHDNGLVLTRVRARGYETDPSLAFFEWAGSCLPFDEWIRGGGDPDDPVTVAAANPALGIRIPAEAIAGERASMSLRSFAVERLGVGDWPSLDPDAGAAIDPVKWGALGDPDMERGADVVFGVDIDQARVGSIAVGWCSNGITYVMLADSNVPAARTAARLAELQDRWGGTVVLGGPSADLADDVPGSSVVSSADFAAACGRLADMVAESTIRHGNQAELNNAVRSSRWRSAGTSGERAIQLKDSPGIGPLAAVVRAIHGLEASLDIVQNVW